MIKYLRLLSFILILFVPFTVLSQQSALRQQIADLAKPANGIVGVSILNIESRDTLNYNANKRLVMQSVMKFPIALMVLHLADTGKFTLNELIKLDKSDLPKNTYSPMRERFPKGKGDISIHDLLQYMVTESDNNACDILLNKVIGGTQPVQDFMLRSGIRGIAIHSSEAEMAADWNVQYTNWCKPIEITALLDMFYSGKILTPASTSLLLKMMTETTTGPNRIKGLLPAGTVVAHKTGSSATSAEGLAPATNDVGIITLPNGKHMAISIFVCNSTADEATRESVIAKIAKAAFDYYAK
jgi:beta-lactamase class A